MTTVRDLGVARALYGPLAQRPDPQAIGDKALYAAPDDGNSLYQVQSGNWVKISAAGGGGGGPGSDTSAVHRDPGSPESGDAAITGDMASATAHVGTVSPPIEQVTAGSVVGTVTVGVTPDARGGRVVLSGRYLVVPDKEGTACVVVDLGDPTAPAVVATIAPHNGTALFLCACRVGTHTVVFSLDDSTGDGGPILEVWDFSTPSAPTYVATGTGLLSHQMEALAVVATSTALVVGGTSSNVNPPGTDYQLLVWDLSTPATPVLRGTLDVAAFSSGNTYPFTILLLSDTLVCLGDEAGVLFLIDISSPAAPTLLGSVTVAAGHKLQACARVDATHVGLVAEATGLYLVSVADPAHPAVTGHITRSTPSGLSTRGTLAYLSDSAGTVETVDCQDPASPVSLGTVSLGGGTLPQLSLAWDSSHLVVHQSGAPYVERVVVPVSAVPYPAQLAGIGSPAATITALAVDTLEATGTVTAHGRRVAELGATATGTIVPDTLITVYDSAGTAYQIPAKLAP